MGIFGHFRKKQPRNLYSPVVSGLSGPAKLQIICNKSFDILYLVRTMFRSLKVSIYLLSPFEVYLVIPRLKFISKPNF